MATSETISGDLIAHVRVIHKMAKDVISKRQRGDLLPLAIPAYILAVTAVEAFVNEVFNTASGAQALFNNRTGSNNIAIGDDALHSNSTGDFNTASGSQALFSNLTGGNNTANGVRALSSNSFTPVSNPPAQHPLPLYPLSTPQTLNVSGDHPASIRFLQDLNRQRKKLGPFSSFRVFPHRSAG